MSKYIETSDIKILISACENGDISSDSLRASDITTEVLEYVGVKTLDIVRCHECGYYRPGNEKHMSYCIGPPTIAGRCVVPWDYCSWGVRK